MSDEQVTKDDLFVELLSRTTLLENKVEGLERLVNELARVAADLAEASLLRFDSMKFKGIENK